MIILMLFPNWGNQSIINYIAIFLARPSPYSSIDMVTEHRPRCMGHHLVLAHPFYSLYKYSIVSPFTFPCCCSQSEVAMLQGHAAAAADVLGIAVRGANGGVVRLTTIDPQVHRSVYGRCIAAHIGSAGREGRKRKKATRKEKKNKKDKSERRGENACLVLAPIVACRH